MQKVPPRKLFDTMNKKIGAPEYNKIVKYRMQRLLLAVVILAIIFSVIIALYFLPKNSTMLVEKVVAFPTQRQMIAGLPDLPMARPSRLNIPKIKVDAEVEYVGFAPDGTMDAPKNSDDVAWFEIGQRPGENGSAVIAGHYGWKNEKASAFDNLYKLRKGDKLYIENDDGEVISFIVRESRRYDPKADASDVFGSNDGKSHLNLVTCEGVWDKASGNYSKRLVVFADRE